MFDTCQGLRGVAISREKICCGNFQISHGGVGEKTLFFFQNFWLEAQRAIKISNLILIILNTVNWSGSSHLCDLYNIRSVSYISIINL